MNGSTWTPDLVLSDEALFDTFYSFEARLVLAVQLGYPQHNPSVDQIAQVAALRAHTVLAAQDELETTFSVWAGESCIHFRHVGNYQLATLDRPSNWRDRLGSFPRYNRSTRLERIATWADPHAAANRKRWASLPGAILERLPRGRKNNALIRLVALAYAREQLRAGAIQIEDSTLAYLLGAKPKQVSAVRRLLVEEGILAFARRERPCDVYTMPGGTPGRPEAPDALDPRKTRRLDHLHVGGFTLRVYASANELAAASRLIDQLTPPLALLALRAGIPWSLGERLQGPEILDALSGFLERQKQQVSGSSQPEERLKPTSRDGAANEPLLPTDDSFFTPSGREGDSIEGKMSLAGLPKVEAALAPLYHDGIPGVILSDLRWTLAKLEEAVSEGEPLTADQEVALDARLGSFLVGLAESDGGPTFGQVREAIRHPSTDDALLEELKRLRPPFELDETLGGLLDGALRGVPE